MPYYSYKPVNNPNDPGYLLEFIPKQEQTIADDLLEIDGLIGKTKEVNTLSDEDAFVFLGYAQTDNSIFGYYYVAENVIPVEQPFEINAQRLDELPAEISNELILNGDYAKYQRFIAGISTMPVITNNKDQHNYAELQSQITDLMTVVSTLLEATPSSLALDDNTLLRIKDTLSKNVSINNKIKDSLSKVGL